MNIDLSAQARLPEGIFKSPLPVNEVLYEAEQPIVYVTETLQGQSMLAYLASETQDAQYIVVAPASEGTLRRLKSGSIGVREALVDSWIWLIKESSLGEPVTAWSVQPEQIPAGHLPVAGTPLLPSQRLAFTARAIGQEIELGNVPCSVVSFVADAARNALKVALDYVLDTQKEGRPTDAQRALYDLPVQQMRFASFEIGLAAPAPDMFENNAVAEAVEILEAGLAWAERPRDDSELDIADDTKAEAVLRAALALTPPLTGAISYLEIGGDWFGGRRFSLDRASRSKVKRHLRLLQDERIVVYEGMIREIDDDKLSIILRDVRLISEQAVPEADLVRTAEERRASFPEDLLDEMRSLYYESQRVRISGLTRSGKLRVTAIVKAPSPGDIGVAVAIRS